jgi:DNA-binding transcriptional MerR regulator
MDAVQAKQSILSGYLSEDAVATGIGVTPRTLRHWRQLRTGPPHIKIGNTTLYSEEGFRRWLQSLEADQVGSRPRRHVR